MAAEGILTPRLARPRPRPRVQLSVITPTYNESENLEALIRELECALHGIQYEILISDDDSPDLTWARAEEISQSNVRVRVLRRKENHGLGPAVVDGFSIARGELVACIDADLQHDPSILPQMLQALEDGADLVVGSRYVAGGGTSNWSWARRFTSWTATKLANWVVGFEVHDPMSGYFMLRREDFLRVKRELNADGFKILLEIAARLRPRRLREVPYNFRARRAGRSKLSGRVVFVYLCQLWRLYLGRHILPRAGAPQFGKKRPRQRDEKRSVCRSTQ